ncbi:MAG: membrane protein insertase YidC [Erysipelotrichales bacterium]
MKYLKNVIIVFMVIMLLTSCTGNMDFTIPVDAKLSGGFEYGIFQGFLVYPIGVLINSLTGIVGSSAVAMMLTTIFVRMVTLPVTLKGQMATKGMQKLQPKMAQIEEKYRGRSDDASNQKKAQEMQKLYKDMDMNPFSAMIYPFISLPIFMAVYRATMFSDIISKSEPFLGFSLGIAPKEAIVNGDYKYIILMIMVAGVQFIQFKLSNHLSSKRNDDKKNESTYRQAQPANAMQKQMKIMTYVFTVMMLFMSYQLKSVMSLYLTISALVSIAQSFYIDKVMRED